MLRINIDSSVINPRLNYKEYLLRRRKIIFIILFFFYQIALSLDCAFCLDKNDYYKLYDEITKADDWVKGEIKFKEAVKEYPDEIIFHIYLNIFLRNQKKKEEALLQIEKIYQKYPDNASIQLNYVVSLLDAGWERVEKGKETEVLSIFRKAYELDPKNEWSINAYGYILLELGQLEQSIAILEQGYAHYRENEYIKGNLTVAYYFLANELRDENDFTRAEKYYVKANKINPDDEWLLFNYGYFYQLKGDIADALRKYERGLKLYPENKYFKPNIIGCYYEYGKSEAEKKNLDSAILILKEAGEKFPDEIWFPAYISEYYVEKRDYLAAAEYIIKMAMIKDKRKMIEGDGIKLETSIYNRMSSVLYHIASERKYNEGFEIIDRLERYIIDQCYVYQLRGVLKYYSGEEEDGLDMVYKAYDLYIANHPEHKKPVAIPLPLRGIYLVAGNSRRDAITHAGMNQFCFDFFGSTEDGKIRYTESRDSGKNEDYIGFGDLLYSPVDGTVESVIDDRADLEPADHYRLIDGNHLTIKDEKGLHYVFVHIKYKSAKVKQGQKVKVGQVVAELGNSGMTTLPHLHFGVYSEDWTVSLPIRFTDYSLIYEDGSRRLIVKGVPQDKEIIEIK